MDASQGDTTNDENPKEKKPQKNQVPKKITYTYTCTY